MKKAIFGGTFDPIHIGHIHIAYEALYNLSLDEVIFMYFLVGVDSLMTLRQWKNIHIILDNCTLVVFSRTGYAMDDVLKMKKDLEKEYGKEIILLEMSLLDISSTEIKKKISEDKMVNYLLPQGVEEVINQYNLYRNKV